MLKAFKVESEARLFPQGSIALLPEEVKRQAKKPRVRGSYGELRLCDILEPIKLPRGTAGRATEATLKTSKPAKADPATVDPQTAAEATPLPVAPAKVEPAEPSSPIQVIQKDAPAESPTGEGTAEPKPQT